MLLMGKKKPTLGIRLLKKTHIGVVSSDGTELIVTTIQFKENTKTTITLNGQKPWDWLCFEEKVKIY